MARLSLDTCLEGIEKVKVADFRDACLRVPRKDALYFYDTTDEFIVNNIALFGVFEDYVFYDFELDRKPDLLNNFKTENVSHYSFLTNGNLNMNIPTDVVSCASMYTKCELRLYFKRDNVPKTFKIQYTSSILPRDVRNQMIMNGVETEHHVYRDGIVYQR